MKILVTMKSIPDPVQKIRLLAGKIDVTGVSLQVNQFDEYALEAALRLTENASQGGIRIGEVLVASIGGAEIQPSLRTALAMGADKAIHVIANAEEMDPQGITLALMKIVQKEQPDIVLMGKLAADHESGEVPQRLAGLLGFPQAMFASSIEMSSDGKIAIVGREVDAGIEFKRVSIPAVISVDLRIISPKAVRNRQTDPAYDYPEGARYASLRGIMAAKKKPLEETTLEQLGVACRTMVDYTRVELPMPRKSGVKVASVVQLVQRLHEEAKVI